ncbi:MAG TPA: carbon starvation CstA family protein, partial [Verrucomicrobiae bacterium]|nr:carbon starvation CstA family protein [Verrucomicrobiae bacterium]
VAAILAIMIILLAVLALVVVKALAESPWGVFTVGATIPIAMLLGGYLRFWRIGKVSEASAFGVVLLLLAVWGGQFVHGHPLLSKVFTLRDINLAWAIIFYGLAASILPVWLLLAPRDYLSTFMKLGTIFALAFGVFLVLPNLKMPGLTKFIDGSGPVVAGKLFPFCFITIACGAISGFHTLISSGTTPKIITRESYSRSIGYGAMCLESLVAIMALIAACTLDPGVYLSMNVKGDPAATIAKINSIGYPVSVDQMNQLAQMTGEKTLFGRTGGAATLAVGMASIFSKVVGNRWLDLWYHFAIMSEALFILTTLDAGTRVGRYLLQDVLGNIWKPLGDTRNVSANVFASLLVVAGWGYFLVQGVRDPLGGINSLWPLFGIANQLLAAIALCLATTVILKMQLAPSVEVTGPPTPEIRWRHPAFALITLLPLTWLLAVTLTAGYQKIFDPDPRIGFLEQAKLLRAKMPDLDKALVAAKQSANVQAISSAENALTTTRTLRFNNQLDAVVAALFMALVVAIFLISLGEWFLLLAGRRLAKLCESKPVWLPESALVEGRPATLMGMITIGLALLRHLSGETELERTAARACATAQCVCSDKGGASVTLLPPTEREQRQRAYVQNAEQRFSKPNRCC